MGRSHKIANPKTTSEIMSSKAVQKWVCGGVGGGEEEKNGLVLKIFFFFCLKFKIHPQSFLTSSCGRRAAAAEQVRGAGGSREGGRKSRN